MRAFLVYGWGPEDVASLRTHCRAPSGLIQRYFANAQVVPVLPRHS